MASFPMTLASSWRGRTRHAAAATPGAGGCVAPDWLGARKTSPERISRPHSSDILSAPFGVNNSISSAAHTRAQPRPAARARQFTQSPRSSRVRHPGPVLLTGAVTPTRSSPKGKAFRGHQHGSRRRKHRAGHRRSRLHRLAHLPAASRRGMQGGGRG